MDTSQYIVCVGPHGTFRPSGDHHSTPEQIDALFLRYESEKPKKITLYFHGGLVNETNGWDTAVKMGKHISDAGHTPICFVWKTGLMDAVRDSLTQLADTELFTMLLKFLIKKISEKLGIGIDLGRGLTNGLTDAEINAELLKPNPFADVHLLDEAARGSNAIDLASDLSGLSEDLSIEFLYLVESESNFTSILEKSGLTEVDETAAGSRGVISTAKIVKHLVVIAVKTIKRYKMKRDHDFYPTIIEELLREVYVSETGAVIWNQMKIKSNEMWENNGGLSGLDRHAGRYLLEKLIAYSQKESGVEINLIGHSAGSIAICNLLKTTASVQNDFAFNKIAFMAPACRTDLFLQEIVSRPQRFKQFRMFTMSDAYETKDKLVPYVYTHSLLYFISGVLENKGEDFDSYILGLQRHISNREPYTLPELTQVYRFLTEPESKRIVFSVTEGDPQPGLSSSAIKHGGFDDDSNTVESLKYFINED